MCPTQRSTWRTPQAWRRRRMCSRIGCSATGTSGFGSTAVYGRSRMPSPPAKMTALTQARLQGPPAGVLVRAQGLVAEPRPREALGDPPPARLAELPPELAVAEEPFERRAEGRNVPRRDEEPRLPVDDEVAQAA